MARLRLVAARLLLVVAGPTLLFAACEGVGWLASIPVLSDSAAYQQGAKMDRCHSIEGAKSNCTPARIRSAEGKFSIAFLGGSSVFGYGDIQSFVPRTRRLLKEHAPARFRVFNFGLYCKDTLYVRACADGVIGPDLDLLVIYAGHNDFANWMGAHPRLTMFVEQNSWLLDLRDRLATTRSYSFLASLIRSPDLSPQAYARPPDAVFHASSQAILDAYTENISAVLDRAALAGVPVILVTLVSNLYEHPHSEDEWDVALGAGPTHANRAAWWDEFAAAVAAHRAGRAQEALAAFKAARDALPLGRAPSAINETLRRFAKEREGVQLIDFERILEADAAGGVIGCNYFEGTKGGKRWCDQFHPAARTHEMLAAKLFERIQSRAGRSR